MQKKAQKCDVVFFYKAVNDLVFVDSDVPAAMLFLLFISDVKNLLINAHFSDTHVPHMECSAR